MTREEQDTERALIHAEHLWLQARGWLPVGAGGCSLVVEQRFAHPAAPKARESYSCRDALAMTRAERLRYSRRSRGALA